MQKSFVAILALVIAAMLGLFILTSDRTNAPGIQSYDATQIQLTDHISGIEPVATEAELAQQLAGKVVLIEYGDFQCPSCHAFFPILQQLKEEFVGELAFVYRHYAIPAGQQSMLAHRAAEAAANQGAFWPMHDLLFARQPSWSNNPAAATLFDSYAEELNLDIEQFRADAASAEVFNRINADKRSSSAYRVTATPTLILNGEVFDGLRTFEALSAAIRQALDSL